MADEKEVPVQTPLEALVAQAMMEKMSQEARDELISKALTSLMRERGGGYGRQTSPLGDAFATAVDTVARQMVLEQVKNNPEIRERIQVIIGKVTEQIMVSDALPELVTTVLKRVIDKVQYE